MKETVQLEGLEPLLALFKQLPTNVAGKLVKPAMKEAGKLLKNQLASNARKQLVGAMARGYRRKTGTHLNETVGARARMYRKGNTTFVAVGFEAREGGYHGHLVELGHEIVRGGSVHGGITAAGQRLLNRMGWEKGNWEGSELILRGKRKGKPRKFKGGWKHGEKVVRGSFFGEHYMGKRIRGGGMFTGNRTRAYPMLGPAFQTMATPMMITIENELRKVETEAVRLAGNVRGGGQVTWGSGKSSAG